jgi:hypothetical protein
MSQTDQDFIQRNAVPILVFSSLLNVVPWGLGMIGIANVVLGAIVLLASLCGGAYAFWTFRGNNWRFRHHFKIGFLAIVFIFSFLFGGRQVIKQYQKEIEQQQQPSPSPPPTPSPMLTVDELIQEAMPLQLIVEAKAFTTRALVPDHEPSVGFTYILTVRNYGKPTIVTGYQLAIKMQDKQEIIIRPKVGGSKVRMKTPDGKNVTYRGSDELSRKTAQQPIPTGGAVSGYLIFLVEGVTESDIFKEGTTIKIGYQDITGKRYYYKYEGPLRIDETGDEILHEVPGLDMSIRPRPTPRTKRKKPKE